MAPVPQPPPLSLNAAAASPTSQSSSASPASTVGASSVATPSATPSSTPSPALNKPRRTIIPAPSILDFMTESEIKRLTKSNTRRNVGRHPHPTPDPTARAHFTKVCKRLDNLPFDEQTFTLLPPSSDPASPSDAVTSPPPPPPYAMQSPDLLNTYNETYWKLARSSNPLNMLSTTPRHLPSTPRRLFSPPRFLTPQKNIAAAAAAAAVAAAAAAATGDSLPPLTLKAANDDDEDEEKDGKQEEDDEDESESSSASLLGSPVTPAVPAHQQPVKSASGKISYKSTLRKVSNYFRPKDADGDPSIRRKLFRSASHAAVSPSAPSHTSHTRHNRHSSNIPLTALHANPPDSAKSSKKDGKTPPALSSPPSFAN